MKIFDLSKNKEYIRDYINLRNKYTKELLTKPISVESTNKWFDTGQGGGISVFVENKKVSSAVIVHKRKEVTIFSDVKGTGNRLLQEAERIAYRLGYNDLWAIPSSVVSENLFMKNGYLKEGSTYKKLLHRDWKYGLRPEAKEYPMMIVLSFSYVCNAKCPNCPYNNSKIRSSYKDSKFMSFNLFKKIADESEKYKPVLRLSGGGEPMFNPDVEKCVNYAEKTGCKTSIITNGSKDVSGILDIVDVLEFSVDAGNKDEYSHTRKGLCWEYLNKNIKNALKKRKKTKIIASIINQKGVDVEDAYNYWSNIVDSVQIRKYLTWGYNRNYSADKRPYLPPEEKTPCPWLFERLNIDSKGNITYCGEDISFKHAFANIKNRSIKSIWQGKEFSKIRKKHLSYQGDHVEMCANCPDWKYRTWNYNYWRLRKNADNNITA